MCDSGGASFLHYQTIAHRTSASGRTGDNATTDANRTIQADTCSLYVVAEYFKLHGQYATLKYKSYQLKKAFAVAKPAVSAAEAEGYELSQGDAKGSSEKAAASPQEKPSAGSVDPELIKRKEALQAEWAVWKDQALINT